MSLVDLNAGIGVGGARSIGRENILLAAEGFLWVDKFFFFLLSFLGQQIEQGGDQIGLLGER